MTRARTSRTALAALVVALGLVASGCGGGDGGVAQAAPAPAPADSIAARPSTSSAASPSAGDVEVQVVTVDAPLSLPAQLYVERDVAIAARADGVLESVRADLGHAVRQGAVLATVESADQRLVMERALADFQDAERVVQRARELRRARGVTVADSETAEFAHRRAEIALAAARRALSLTNVVAPFTGVVSARYVGPHRLVRAGDTLFRLTETGPLLARVRVPEGQAAGLQVGSGATVAGLDGTAAPGRVARLAPTVDAASGTREVIVAVTAGRSLRPGSAVTVRLGSSRREAVVVPRDVVTEDGHVLVREGGRAVLRAVTLGPEVADGRVEVLAGLSAGERVARPRR